MSGPTLDDVLDFSPVGNGGGSVNDYVDEGYWHLVLNEISMPFEESDFTDPYLMVPKVRFYFEIDGGYNKITGEREDSEFNGAKVSAKIKADSNGPKSTKYAIASALLSQDLQQWVISNNRNPKPSELVGFGCWGKIVQKQGKKDPNKFYTEIQWDSFTHTLPAVLYANGRRPVQAAQRPVQQQAQPQRPVTPASRPAPKPQPAKPEVAPAFDEEGNPLF